MEVLIYVLRVLARDECQKSARVVSELALNEVDSFNQDWKNLMRENEHLNQDMRNLRRENAALNREVTALREAAAQFYREKEQMFAKRIPV